MKKYIQFPLVLILLMSLFLTSCDETEEVQKIDPGFSEYIVGFTSGIISKNASFRIDLAVQSKMYTEQGQEIAEDLFDFSPSVSGTAYWVDANTIEFKPTEMLSSGTAYTIEFELGKVLDVAPKFEEFEYQIHTIKQNFDVKVNGINTYDMTDLVWNQVEGEMLFADVMKDDEVEKMLEAQLDNNSLNFTWQHNVEGTLHKFTVDSVKRTEDEQELTVEWDGDQFDLDSKGEIIYTIPSLSDFKVMNVQVFRSPEQYMLINFSDPLLKNQKLDGLIHLDNNSKLKFTIEGNKVKVYPKSRLSGTKTLVFERGIKNVLGYKLKEKLDYTLAFEDYKPAIELEGKGTILPSTDGLIFPFKAVNLTAVDVKIIKIFENNVKQFLQVNSISESWQMRRVGRPVFSKKVNLVADHVVDKGIWNNYFLDLSEFIEAEPGAIYRVELNFKRSYSLYPCEASEEVEDQSESTNWDEAEEEVEFSYWDYTESYNYDWEWEDRDDPCSKSYYNYRSTRPLARNILASNLGVIAKMGNNKKLVVAVTDMRTTKPLSNVTVELYNYQNQLISSKKTDGDGMLEVELKNKPHLLVAKKGKERGYLKLDDGSALSTSKFDVRGKKVQKGIKGFIYGERGVWRPGDSLFLSFILEDKEGLLPKKHPVKLELVNPLGQTTHKVTTTNGVDGFYQFTLTTADDAPTGSWLAKVKVGGVKFEKFIRIEAIKPNRLKVKLDFNTEIISAQNPDMKGSLEVKWLHGAVAKNLKTKVAIKLTHSRTTFKKYEDYTFTDPGKSFGTVEQDLFEGKLDGQGKAVFYDKVKVNSSAPGMLRATFVTRVFEEGGDFSIDKFSIPYSPYKSYVGVSLPQGDQRGMLLTDTTHVGEIATLDYLGNPVSVSNVEVNIYKVRWRWWWESSSEDVGSYLNTRHAEKIKTIRTSSENGKGSFKFKVDYPEWGRYYVQVKNKDSGHITGKFIYMDWPGWAGRGERENPGGVSLLSFSSDKANYKVGEKAMISIPSSGKGRALLTVESGSKVLQAKWIEVENNEILHSITVTPEMAPNVYVHVTMLQPHKHDNSLPIRMYGVIPLMVEDPGTILKPQIEMPEELAPLSRVKVKVSEKDGKAMTYTVAIVDEGLLDLTRFKTPNPHPVFYAREALGVKTWDFYDYVIGAYGGKLEGILSVGGDEGMNGKAKNKVKRFKPMVRFIGPFELGKGDNNEHIIAIPNYIGAVRTMVIAGKEGAYGRTEKSTPVKKPLMVLASLPRVLGPKELVKLPVTIFAMDEKIKDVKVKVVTNELFGNKKVQTQTIHFDEMGEGMVNFNLQVGTKAGAGKVQIFVECGKEKASTEVDISVRHANPRQTKAFTKTLKKGVKDSISFEVLGLKGTNKLTLEISSIPSINLNKRLEYLLGYPHGCVEQTTSKTFPQLFIGDVMELNEQQKERAKQNILTAINKLRNFQVSSGGFAYWSGSSHISDYATSYVGHFLLEAEKKGYTVPASMKNSWVGYQQTVARNYSSFNSNSYPSVYGSYFRYSRPSYDFAQAYRLFTLALAGKAEIGAMNRLKEDNKLNYVGMHRLAASYYLMGEKAVASSILKDLKVDATTRRYYGYSYGSSARDQAILLECYTIMKDDVKARRALKKVAKPLGKNRYMNTQAVAYSLMSISKYVGGSGVAKELKFSTLINGKKKNHIVNSTVGQLDVPLSAMKDGKIEVHNTGSGMLFATVISSGIPGPGDEKTISSNMVVSVKYMDMKGQYINVTKLDQGTDFVAEVTVKNEDLSNPIDNVALTHVFPSGWEIFNQRLFGDGDGNDENTSSFDYQDIRDDRVLTYFGLSDYRRNSKYSSKTFKVILNASYLGKYYLPSVNVGSMYDDDYKASEPGKWVEVVKPGN